MQISTQTPDYLETCMLGMQSIIKAFRMASELAVAKVKELSISLEGNSDIEKKELLKKCAMTTLNSKLVRAGWCVHALGSCAPVAQ